MIKDMVGTRNGLKKMNYRNRVYLQRKKGVRAMKMYILGRFWEEFFKLRNDAVLNGVGTPAVLNGLFDLNPNQPPV